MTELFIALVLLSVIFVPLTGVLVYCGLNGPAKVALAIYVVLACLLAW